MEDIILRWKLEKDMIVGRERVWVLRIYRQSDWNESSIFGLNAPYAPEFEKLIIFPQIPVYDEMVYDYLAQYSHERYGVGYKQVWVWVDNYDITDPSDGNEFYVSYFLKNYNPLLDY